MSPISGSRAQSHSTSQGVSTNSQSQHKRKREEAGHTEPRGHNENKRHKVKTSSKENTKVLQRQNPEVVPSTLQSDLGKDENLATHLKAAKLLMVSESKAAKRERRKAKREQKATSHNRGGEENKPNKPSLTPAQDAGSQMVLVDPPIRREKQCMEGQLEAAPTWKLSEPVGGRFFDHEPLFSADEKSVPLSTCLF